MDKTNPPYASLQKAEIRGLNRLDGGESGIRTLGEFDPTQHFECCTFDHSDNSPYKKLLGKMRENCEIRCGRATVSETLNRDIPQFDDNNRDKPDYVSSAPRYDHFDTSPDMCVRKH